MHIYTEVYISDTHTCADTCANMYVHNKNDFKRDHEFDRK